ncbi:hypothetical protein F5X99DRAFT_407020 [Biscogniauxia marginata]|nr:hypothetical protein F5X99DRAFT_407020 [Biscogniauxia marginata]
MDAQRKLSRDTAILAKENAAVAVENVALAERNMELSNDNVRIAKTNSAMAKINMNMAGLNLQAAETHNNKTMQSIAQATLDLAETLENDSQACANANNGSPPADASDDQCPIHGDQSSSVNNKHATMEEANSPKVPGAQDQAREMFSMSLRPSYENMRLQEGYLLSPLPPTVPVWTSEAETDLMIFASLVGKVDYNIIQDWPAVLGAMTNKGWRYNLQDLKSCWDKLVFPKLAAARVSAEAARRRAKKDDSSDEEGESKTMAWRKAMKNNMRDDFPLEPLPAKVNDDEDDGYRLPATTYDPYRDDEAYHRPFRMPSKISSEHSGGHSCDSDCIKDSRDRNPFNKTQETDSLKIAIAKNQEAEEAACREAGFDDAIIAGIKARRRGYSHYYAIAKSLQKKNAEKSLKRTCNKSDLSSRATCGSDEEI